MFSLTGDICLKGSPSLVQTDSPGSGHIPSGQLSHRASPPAAGNDPSAQVPQAVAGLLSRSSVPAGQARHCGAPPAVYSPAMHRLGGGGGRGAGAVTEGRGTLPERRGSGGGRSWGLDSPAVGPASPRPGPPSRAPPARPRPDRPAPALAVPAGRAVTAAGRRAPVVVVHPLRSHPRALKTQHTARVVLHELV